MSTMQPAIASIRIKLPRAAITIRAHRGAESGIGIEVSGDCGSYLATPTIAPADARALAAALVQQAEVVESLIVDTQEVP